MRRPQWLKLIKQWQKLKFSLMICGSLKRYECVRYPWQRDWPQLDSITNHGIVGVPSISQNNRCEETASGHRTLPIHGIFSSHSVPFLRASHKMGQAWTHHYGISIGPLSLIQPHTFSLTLLTTMHFKLDDNEIWFILRNTHDFLRRLFSDIEYITFGSYIIHINNINDIQRFFEIPTLRATDWKFAERRKKPLTLKCARAWIYELLPNAECTSGKLRCC